MSGKDNGSRMDPPSVKPGSVARARMLAEERQQRGVTQDERISRPYSPPTAESQASPASRNLKPKGIAQHEGGAGKIISRPSPMPQFPAPEVPSPTGHSTSPGQYRPPANRPPQAPQRPPRPSRIPSMVDQARLQEPTPLFIAPVRMANSPQDSVHGLFSQSPQYSSGQPSSNTAYISEMPLNNAMGQVIQPKKSVTLGPPPSSRRGASSFYSNASFVSPIMEESSHSRSHGSYASSTAMPENWSSPTGYSRQANKETFYEESVTDVSPESIYDDYGDESRLVKPVELDSTPTVSSVANQSKTSDITGAQTAPMSEPGASWGAYKNRSAAGYPSIASTSVPIKSDLLPAYAASGSASSSESRPGQESLAKFSRNSAIRPGLRIDIDAVREAEARGSLTSLPDLIRRATRLAAMIEKGKRPTSRMDNLSDFLGDKQINTDGRQDTRGGRPPSGLSDMLAAFPPPVSTPQFNNGPSRSSWPAQGGWPLTAAPKKGAEKRHNKGKSKRRCCGLPLWAAIMVAILLLCVIVAAIVVPLELFVFSKNGSSNGNTGLQKCQKSLACQNGGTNVVSHGTCSCICTGGFTGSDCGTAGSVGCTTTDLVSTDKMQSIKNVTLGQAIPRLIAEANSNFTVPLSGTSILAKINASGLSCIAQNSLVTFNGRFSEAALLKQQTANAKRAPRQTNAHVAAESTNFAMRSDELLANRHRFAGPAIDASAVRGRANDGGSFTATDDAVDFCRVAVLFVLQEQDLDTAENAQISIQAFLSKVTAANSVNGPKVPQQEAANITIGHGGSINLLKFNIDIGGGLVGGLVATPS